MFNKLVRNMMSSDQSLIRHRQVNNGSRETIGSRNRTTSFYTDDDTRSTSTTTTTNEKKRSLAHINTDSSTSTSEVARNVRKVNSCANFNGTTTYENNETPFHSNFSSTSSDLNQASYLSLSKIDCMIYEIKEEDL